MTATIQAGGNCVESFGTRSRDEMLAACGDLLRLSELLTGALLQATMEALEDGWDWAYDNVLDPIGEGLQFVASVPINLVAFVAYTKYWVAYQTLRLLNKMPGQSEWIIKPLLWPVLMRLQIEGLRDTALMDMAEYALRIDSDVFDEGVEKDYIIPVLGEQFDLGPKKVLPGIHPGGWPIDIEW